jgi:hypothetical protein
MASFKPTHYLTIEELQQIAKNKFAEAAGLPLGPQRQKVLKSAYGYRSLAEMRGWLCGELHPPK